MRARSLACGLAALSILAAGGCADPGRPFLASAGLATDLPASAPAREAAGLISRSVRGVVPVAPRRGRAGPPTT
jgi:hypothetical protein